VFPIANGAQLDVSMGAGPPQTLALNGPLANLAAVAAELETQIRAADPAPEFADARVLAHTDPDDRLIVLAGVSATAVTFTQTGADTTFSDLELDAGSASAVTARVSTNLATVPTLPAGSALDVTLGATGPARAVTAAAANTLAGIARELQAGIRAADAAATFAGARVGDHTAGGENRLVVLAGTAGDVATLATAPVDITTVNQLRLDAGTAQSNVQAYTLGNAAAIANTAQGAGVAGNDGDPPDATALIGDLNAKTGLFALEDVDLFNILCIPRTATVSGNNSPLTAVAAGAVITAAINYCEQRRAFFIVDTPSNVDEVQEIKDWLDANATLRHRNAALYFPRVQIPDPLDGFRLRAMGAGGTMAGLYARTDGSRGVWKAPAGIEAGLTNVQRFDYVLSDAENGTLNPLGINALRSFPVYGNVAWGGRTLDGADQQASEWKYIPVRRLALFLEESLYRGLQWVVFEPNDEPLWAQIRLNVGAFMHNLFRQGAFQGTTPRQAYLVKCDAETTTQNDIDRGIVNILVGFAPLKPAEFVIIQIQQLAGQVQT
jgi:hypothetical protein